MNLIKKLFSRRSNPKPLEQIPAPKAPEMAKTGDGSNYSPDQPIRSKNEDRFNRWPFAERIAQTIAGRQDPSSIVIGLYGAWGEGKSSVLAMMEDALAAQDHIVCVRFNPWYFKTEEQLLHSFFSTLAKAIGKSLPTKAQEIGNALERYGSILSVTALIPGAPNPTATVQGIGRAIGSTSDLDALRSRIESFLRSARRRVVVLVDDIDRLDRREIQTIFKLVKLSANFENTAYVLAFDDKMVSEALGENYGAGGADAGRNFLEKIVQVPLHLPPADTLELRRIVFEGVDASLKTSGIELTEEQVQEFIRHFVDGIEPQLGTPRQAKLYTNALTFALPLMKGEVNPVDQMLIEGIRVFYPSLYATIRDNADVFTSQAYEISKKPFQDRAATLIEAALAPFEAQHADNIRRRLLYVLFPRLESALGNMNYGSDWDKSWEIEQRVCSKDYFDRYFRYGVMSGDVSDIVLGSFLDQLATSDKAEIDKLFAPFNNGERLGRLIAKLRLRKERFDPATAIRLANVLARNGSNLPPEKAMLLSDWSFMQAGILIAELLRCVTAGPDRDEAARSLFIEIGHLPFALECARWMHPSKKEGAEEPLFSQATEDQLEEVLVGRIRVAASEAPLYKTFGADAPRLLFTWKRREQAGEVAKHLEDGFTADPADVGGFLGTFVGTAWGMESGLPQKSDFHREQYDSVGKLINPSLLLAHLRKQYGAELDKADEHQPQEMAQTKRVSLQFALCHRIAQQTPTDKVKE